MVLESFIKMEIHNDLQLPILSRGQAIPSSSVLGKALIHSPANFLFQQIYQQSAKSVLQLNWSEKKKKVLVLSFPTTALHNSAKITEPYCYHIRLTPENDSWTSPSAG